MVTDAEQPEGVWLGKVRSQAERHQPCIAGFLAGTTVMAEWQGTSEQVMLQAEALRLCHDGHMSGAVQAPGKQPPPGKASLGA